MARGMSPWMQASLASLSPRSRFLDALPGLTRPSARASQGLAPLAIHRGPSGATEGGGSLRRQ